MDLSYSEEQSALRDAAEKLLRQRYTAAHRRQPGAFWPVFAEQGWLGLLFAEEHGGVGGSMIEVCLLAEAMGRNLAAEPFVSSVFASSLIAAAGDGPRARRCADGQLRFAVAHEDAAQTLPAIAVREGAGWRLSGRKVAILDAAADVPLLVTARDPTGADGVFIVERPGAALTLFPTVDERTAARLSLDGLVAERLGAGDHSTAIALAFDRAVCAQIADISGAMQAALDATVAYAKVRVQFGQPIGANQVIRHRLVAMAVHCEEARSLTLKAAILTCDDRDAAARGRTVAGAKVKVARMARAVCEDAVQIHGGMGVTEELEIGHYLKRAIAFEAALGTPRRHRARYRRAAA